jgi:hypothetical protein
VGLAGERRVAVEDRPGVADEHVLVEVVVLDRDLDVCRVAAADPGGGARRGVPEQAVAAGRPEERDVLVGPWRGGAHRLDHVEVDRLSDLVQPPRLLTEAVHGLP